MTKNEFIKKLRNKLSALPESEANDAVSFYEEYFADGLEMGKSEEQLTERLDLELIASDLISKSDISSRTSVKEPVQSKEKSKTEEAAAEEKKAGVESGAKKEQQSDVKENIYCSACGAVNNIRFKFCSKCGNALQKSSAAEPVKPSSQKASVSPAFNNTPVKHIKLYKNKSLVIRDTSSVILMLCLLPITIPLLIAAGAIVVIVPGSVMFSLAAAFYSSLFGISASSVATVITMIGALFGISQFGSISIICLYLGGALILLGLSLMLMKTVKPVTKFFIKAFIIIGKTAVTILQWFFRVFGIIIVNEEGLNNEAA